MLIFLYSTAFLGLLNGGSAGFLYTNLATWIGFLAVYASLAEMGSMAPTYVLKPMYNATIRGRHLLTLDLDQVVNITG